ncbi:hypothetical protein U9M48_035025 [Paspalum notatum var. saurae]|uniref:Uncharacterized protein n=1 Tax=Paspalum notatum var. saurae TaxID=547442 RepID=A0AAQ3UC49_PASNO
MHVTLAVCMYVPTFQCQANKIPVDATFSSCCVLLAAVVVIALARIFCSKKPVAFCIKEAVAAVGPMLVVAKEAATAARSLADEHARPRRVERSRAAGLRRGLERGCPRSRAPLADEAARVQRGAATRRRSAASSAPTLGRSTSVRSCTGSAAAAAAAEQWKRRRSC